MEKIDARTLKDEALHERHRQVLRLHKCGGSPAQIAQVSELSYPAVRKIIRLYETRGAAGIKPGKRGRRAGENRSLSKEQERLLQQFICEKRPEQMKMDFALWNRAAVSQLIKQECPISMPIRTVGHYLKRWGFTPQKPIKKAYEQRPEAVKQWLDEQYPEIARRARTEGGEIHWGDETALVNTDVRGRGFAPKGKTPVAYAPGTRQRLSMIATVTKKGCARWQIIDGNFDSDRLIEFLELLIKDTGRKVFLILDNLRVHHSKPVKAWLEKNKEKIECFYLPSYSPEPVKEFGCFTEDIEAMADWLIECGVDVVAMESTGVYWIAPYEILESRGLIVYLVNARHVRHVSGRKSDVLDCQWLQQLMSFGLLSGAFRPVGEICALRAISRQRDTLLNEQARQVQRMQKALTQMNVQLTNVIADIVGKTGQDIIRAIVAGERDPHKLAKLRNYRIHASAETIAKSLEGNWREEHVFCLSQALSLFDAYQALIVAVDVKLEEMIKPMRQHQDALAANKNKGRGKNAPTFDARNALYQWVGVDLTRIGGIDVSTALKVLVEIGPDLSKFENAKRFASWLGLCPGTKISGGKKLSSASKRIPNRVAQALKLAAQGLHRSHCALGAYYRRMAARMGVGKAITATAHKLARLIFAMLTKGGEYVERSQEQYENQMHKRTVAYLKRKAAAFGFTMQPINAV